MNNTNILLASEDKEVAAKIKHRLENESFVLHTVDDGLSALKYSRQVKPDIIILSDILFKLDGYKVCRLLKHDEQYKNLSVLLLIAQEQALDSEFLKYLGADDYITKPYNLDTLIEKIKKL
jgi:two-component system alkaline phosphatase synthesis response regulator PhoP